MGTKFAVVGCNLVVVYEEKCLRYLHNYVYKILSTFLYVTTFGF